MLVPMIDMFNHGNFVGSSIPDIDSGLTQSSTFLEQNAAGPSENVRCGSNALKQELLKATSRQSSPWDSRECCAVSYSGRRKIRPPSQKLVSCAAAGISCGLQADTQSLHSYAVLRHQVLVSCSGKFSETTACVSAGGR